jgi:hypothetical protein
VRAALLVAALTIIVGCGAQEPEIPAAAATATLTPLATASTPPSAIPTSSATGSPVAFPPVPLIAGTSTGELQIWRGGKWDLETKICSDPQPSGSAITALVVAADGATLFVQCFSKPAGTSDLDARDAFIYDLVAKRKTAIAGTSALGIGPLSPDGRQLVVASAGDCPMPAPVCQTKRVLIEVASGSKREILPSDYWLGIEMRWTALGLTYFLPECAEAGCPGPQRSGTYLWNGSTWAKLSPDRLVATNGRDRHVFERRKSLNDRETSIVVVERVGTVDRVLTTAGPEVALALMADGRIVTWRASPPGGFDGQVVVYRDGQEQRRTNGRFSSYIFGTSSTWIVSGELSGAPSWKIHAYSVDQDAFTLQTPPFSLSRMVVVP